MISRYVHSKHYTTALSHDLSEVWRLVFANICGINLRAPPSWFAARRRAAVEMKARVELIQGEGKQNLTKHNLITKQQLNSSTASRSCVQTNVDTDVVCAREWGGSYSCTISDRKIKYHHLPSNLFSLMTRTALLAPFANLNGTHGRVGYHKSVNELGWPAFRSYQTKK